MNQIKNLAHNLSQKKFKKVAVMTGAGISVNAGIPDFRTPITGLYAQIDKKFGLPFPEAIFDINYFKQDPHPFFQLALKLTNHDKKPTLTHYFLKLLEEKEILYMCYTQNIDSLEKKAGLSPSKLVQAHGNVDKAHCISCHKEFPQEKMLECFHKETPAYCDCGSLAKPDVVFFGENLAQEFHKRSELIIYADLLLVIGTGLQVFPFATLTERVSDDTPRYVINKGSQDSFENNGFKFGSEQRDFFIDGDCDEVVKEITREAGWESDLNQVMTRFSN